MKYLLTLIYSGLPVHEKRTGSKMSSSLDLTIGASIFTLIKLLDISWNKPPRLWAVINQIAAIYRHIDGGQ